MPIVEGEYSIERSDGVWIVQILDLALLEGHGIRKAGEAVLRENDGVPCILIDFSKVEYLSSAVLGELVALYKRIRAMGGRINLCSVKDSIMEILQVTKMTDLFDVFPAREEALTSLAT